MVYSVTTLRRGHVEPYSETIRLSDHTIEIQHLGCDDDLGVMAATVAELDGRVDAIALQGVARDLRLDKARVEHAEAARLFGAARKTVVVDGSGVRGAIERWAVRLVADAQPGIWSRKRVLMTPGLNHSGLAQALGQYTETLRYADPVLYFALPGAPGVGSVESLPAVAMPSLNQLRDYSFSRLFPAAGTPGHASSPKLFQWADVLAGDIGAIRRYAPADLRRKIVVVEAADEADVADLKARGATAIITTMPPLGHELARFGAATFEACLVAIRPDPAASLTENTYLNLMADMEWQPGVKFLQPEEAELNRFAFVIHPLSTRFIHKHPAFRWTRFLPDTLVERVAAHLPPMYLGR
ncbi:MAG TPA: serine carboxypeptidase, partial [Anaerolineae bacterium]